MPGVSAARAAAILRNPQPTRRLPCQGRWRGYCQWPTRKRRSRRQVDGGLEITRTVARRGRPRQDQMHLTCRRSISADSSEAVWQDPIIARGTARQLPTCGCAARRCVCGNLPPGFAHARCCADAQCRMASASCTTAANDSNRSQYGSQHKTTRRRYCHQRRLCRSCRCMSLFDRVVGTSDTAAGSGASCKRSCILTARCSVVM